MIDCYEHFDFDPQHVIKNEYQVYNPTTKTINDISQKLWMLLNLITGARKIVMNYREDTHDGVNLETAAIYQQLLDGFAGIKKAAQPFANEFCIAYKGYSLN